MSTELNYPDMDAITFATPEDAKQMATVLNDLFGQLMWLETKQAKTQQELDGMWEHIRNLEQKLLPSEQVSHRSEGNSNKDPFFTQYVKPNCY